MKARLTRIEAKRRGETFELGPGEVRIGRDPDSDLVIEGVRISRLHAMIRTLGGRHTLTDSNSTNGTTVNGVPLARAPVLLESNDLIEFAGEAAYLYEAGPTVVTRRWLIAAASMLALLLLASALAIWQRVLNDPVMDAATSLAREGQLAGERGDLLVARERLSEAARLIVRSGYLDHVERSALMPEAMALLSRQIEGRPDLWALLLRAEQAEQERAGALLREPSAPEPAVDMPPAERAEDAH